MAATKVLENNAWKTVGEPGVTGYYDSTSSGSTAIAQNETRYIRSITDMPASGIWIIEAYLNVEPTGAAAGRIEAGFEVNGTIDRLQDVWSANAERKHFMLTAVVINPTSVRLYCIPHNVGIKAGHVSKMVAYRIRY